MTLSIKLRDYAGELTITLDDLEAFHDKYHFGGVVLSMKVLQRAFDAFPDAGIPHRNEIAIVAGLNPPGLIDSFEFMTRAVSRRRLVIDTMLPDGPPSPFGRFAFEIHRPCGAVALWVRDGLLPADFATTGKKVEAGFGTEAEIARWTGYKRDVGVAMIPMKPEDVLDIRRIEGRRLVA
jgi:hypothetical protein